MAVIYINMRFLTQKITGVQRFAFSICQALDQLIDSSKFEVIGLMPSLPIHNQYANFIFTNIKIKPCGKLKGHLWEQIELPWFSRDHYLLNLCNTAPIIKLKQFITLHDVLFMTDLDSHKLWFKLWYQLIAQITTRSSRKIFTVSQFSKSEIHRLLKVDLDKIIVLGNAASIHLYPYADQVLSRLGLMPKEFYLMIGSNSARKNTRLVTNLFANTPELKECKLVVVGGQFANLGAIKPIEADNIIYTGYISDSELRSLYKHARALIFPSLAEGFGIPVIEAISEGTPVIASDIPVLHEVCGDSGAVYFDPYSPDSLLAATCLINDYLPGQNQTYLFTGTSHLASWNQLTIQLAKVVLSVDNK